MHMGKNIKTIIYALAIIFLVILYCKYTPWLMDYYVSRPDCSFMDFCSQNTYDDVYSFEAMLIGLLFFAIFCLTLNECYSVLILSLLLFILSHASYTKYINRRELLLIDDLKLTEAAGMALNYFSISLNKYLLYYVGITLFFILLFFCIERFRKSFSPISKTKETIIAKIVGFFICCFMSVYLVYTLLPSQDLQDLGNYANITPTATNNYILYRFLKNDSLVPTDIENAEDSYSYILSSEDNENTGNLENYPNVIVIMNESWWNTDNIDSDKISFSQNPMQPFVDLDSKCRTGYLSSNVFGGGTVSSEFEFLSGLNTKYYTSSSGIYETIKNRKVPSIVDYFNSLDYSTTAIHPYYGDFYDRETIYNTMEFDKTIFDEDMLYRDIYTRYISDESMANQII